MAPLAGTETQIRMAAIRNILDQARVELQSLQDQYSDYYRYWQALLQTLGMPSVRSAIRIAAERAASAKWGDLTAEHSFNDSAFLARMKDFRKNYLITAWAVTIITAAIVLCTWQIDSWRESAWWWGVSGLATVATVFIWLNYKWRMRAYRRKLAEQLEELNSRKAMARRDFMETQLSFHAAGMWLDRYQAMMLQLNRTYDRLVSFNNNLRGWYAEDERHGASLPERNGRMFVYYDHPDLLVKTFQANREQIVAQIDLMATFDSYRVDAETIQEARGRLRDTTRKAIEPIFADFSITEYLGGRDYPYLPGVKIDRELGTLLSLGLPSARNNAVDPQPPIHMLRLENASNYASRWRSKAHPCFPFPPQEIASGDSCVLDLITVQAVASDTLR